MQVSEVGWALRIKGLLWSSLQNLLLNELFRTFGSSLGIYSLILQTDIIFLLIWNSLVLEHDRFMECPWYQEVIQNILPLHNYLIPHLSV